MSELLALGASHKTAPLALRERIALHRRRRAEALLRELVGDAGDPARRSSLSTCNRTELYLVVGDPVEAETAVLGAARAPGRACGRPSCSRASTRCATATPRGTCTASTSGLESMVVGEAEVQGQVKRAYEVALAARTTGPLTNKLFRAALATGKRVRTRDGDLRGRRERRLGRGRRRARRARRPRRAATC